MQDKIDNGEKVVVGKSVDDELKNALDASNGFEDEEDKYRERILRVRYLASQAKLMGRFFKENNIQFEFIEK
jgi:hypothetical protein